MSMATLAPTVQGSIHTPKQITWQRTDGSAVDLTNAALTGTIKDTKTGVVTAISGTLNVTNATGGVFTWAMSSTDAGTPGTYEVQFTATYSDQKPDTSLTANWTILAKN